MPTRPRPRGSWPRRTTHWTPCSATARCALRSLGGVIAPLRYEDGVLLVLDQTRLPGEELWLRCSTPADVAEAIERLAVRGAPAIGVAAAYGLALAPPENFESAADLLAAARPTAVNLRWAIDQVRAAGPAGALEAARSIEERERDATRRIAEHGAAL